MDQRRDHSWYRDEARRTRERAAAVKNDEQLRDSYLALAREYERLADLLEANRADTAEPPATPVLNKVCGKSLNRTDEEIHRVIAPNPDRHGHSPLGRPGVWRTFPVSWEEARPGSRLLLNHQSTAH
jgi:hypothetical protein